MTLHIYLTQSSVCRDNSIAEFCANFKLKVNKIKTKVLIFKNGGVLSRVDKWFYKVTPIDVVNGFTYIGLLFTTRLSFNQMVNELRIDLCKFRNIARKSQGKSCYTSQKQVS